MFGFLDLRAQAVLVRGFAKQSFEHPNEMKTREPRQLGNGARRPSPATVRAHGKVGSEVRRESSSGPRLYG
jgi:hypothetical protein